METASKALLIAGSVLLVMLMLTVAIILYNSFSSTADKYSERLNATELAKFNTNFETFRGRTDIKAQEITSLINIIAEYRKKTKMDVDIEVDGTAYGEGANTITFLKNNLEKIFTCTSIEYNSLGEVKRIIFTTNTT